MNEKFGKGITYLRAISEYAQKNINEDDIKEVLNVIEKTRKYFNRYNINEQSIYTIRLMKEAASEGYSKAINYLQIRCSI